MDLAMQLRPFPPDYTPAIGMIDTMCKVLRPDGKPEVLGIDVLDEPAPQQSDPGVVELHLREEARNSDLAEAEVRSVPGDADVPTREKMVREWMQSIADLHRSKPPPTVHYTRPMPDVEDDLMAEMPDQMQEAMANLVTWGSDIDLSVEQYARVILTLFDIPVLEDSVIESLHLLFTVYSEFADNPMFNKTAPGRP